MTDQTIQQLNLLLNTEVTPQQLRKIDPYTDYLIKVTKRSQNNRVTYGILMLYGSELAIRCMQHQNPELDNENMYHIVKRKPMGTVHMPTMHIMKPGNLK